MTYVNVPGNELTSHSVKSPVPCLEWSRLNYLKSQSLKLGREDQVHSEAEARVRLHAVVSSVLRVSSSKSPEMHQSRPLLGSGWVICSREEADSVANGGRKKLDSHSDGSVWNCSEWNKEQKMNRCVLTLCSVPSMEQVSFLPISRFL